MSVNLLTILIMAASADRVIAKTENNIINTYIELYPNLKSLSTEDIRFARETVRELINMNGHTNFLETVGKEMSAEEKSVAYALALEVCAADFNMVIPQETDFLQLLVDKWSLNDELVKSLQQSVSLRYGITL